MAIQVIRGQATWLLAWSAAGISRAFPSLLFKTPTFVFREANGERRTSDLFFEKIFLIEKKND